MNPTAKRILRIVIVLAVLVAVAEVVITYFHEDRIKELTINQLNEFLITEVEVESVDFSFFRQFPKASVQFKNILIKDPTGKGNDPISAKSLFLEFDPFDLLTGTYIIDEIQLNDAHIAYHHYGTNKHNFQFFQTDSSSEELRIELEEIDILSSSFTFINHPRNNQFVVDLHELRSSGSFTKEVFDMDVVVAARLKNLMISSFKLNRAYDLDLKFELDVNRSENKIDIKKVDTRLGDLMFAWNGSFYDLKTDPQLKLSFKSQKARFKDIKEILPPRLISKFEQFDASGHFDLDGELEGPMGGGNFPSIDLEFALENGRLKHLKQNIRMDSINLKGSVSNGKERSARSSALYIDSIWFIGDYGLTQGQFSIVNFDDPVLKFAANTVINLGKISNLIENDSLELLSGKCEVDISSQFKIDSLSNITAKDMKKANTNGKVVFTNVEFKYTGMPHAAKNVNGRLSFYPYNILLDSLSLSINEVPLYLSGRIHNLLPFIFFKGESLTLEADLVSEKFDLNKLMEREGANKDGSGVGLPLAEQLTIILNFDTEQFAFRKFRADRARGSLKLKYPHVLLQKLNIDAMEGNVKGWIQLDHLKLENLFDLKSEVELTGVNIYQLFLQCENFGQSSITSDHLRGYANVDMDFNSQIKPGVGLVAEKTYVRSHVEIKNGELIQYEPVLALSKYVEVSELEHIKFSKLTNDIEIKDKMVYIPEMDVVSSALELKLSGKHGFDNTFDYHFELYLNDFLFSRWRRNKKRDSEFGEIEEEEGGGSKIHVRMEGSIDDYKIKLDRKGMRENWNENFQEERKELKAIFKEEFSGEPSQKNEAPMNFEIEWEDPDFQADTTEKKENLPKSEAFEKKAKEKEGKKKSLLDRLGGENEEEFESYDPDKYD